MFLKKFDFLSPNITLYYYNQKRHSSSIGGLLTILLIVFAMYIIIQYSFVKVYPSSSSLLIYKNFDKEITISFNKTGLFHYIWIFNTKYIIDDKINQNLIQLNNHKRGAIRIYMIYSSDKNNYNSSNLKDNDHWVYDTCSNYVNEEDLIFDYSFSSCIKYYYNSKDKKYYSSNDNEKFKWPYIQLNISNIDNNFFGIFVEKCVNNSILNEILGECYPEEKIDEYLNYFNNIFLSFINCKIQINEDNPIKLYSYKIYDNIINDNISFYMHDLTFIPLNYKSTKGIIPKKVEYNSFMFDNDISKKIYNNNNNNKILISYIFNSKKYINEFRDKNNDFIEILNGIGGSLFIMYIFFYGFNYILNERIVIWNFQMFLNDKSNDLIYRNINYEKNKAYSFKSNIYTNLSNDLNNKSDDINTFKSTYLGKFLKNDLIKINNITNDENVNSKNNNNNYTIKINRIESEDKEMGKKSDNIIVINNNSFVNDNSNNKYIDNSLEKYNSLKVVNRYNNFENIHGYHKIYTYNKAKNESSSLKNKNSIIKDNNLTFVKVNKNLKNTNYERVNSKRNESVDYNSRQKIIDTSSVNLLNSTNQNRNQNLFISSSYNHAEVKDTPLSNNDKTVNFNFFSKLNTKIQDSNKILPRQNISFKNNNLELMHNFKPKKSDKLMNKTNITIEKKTRRKSHQPRINLISEKDLNEKYKNHKAKTRKTFLKMPDNKPERHLSLFSKNSYNNNSSANPNEKTNDNNINIISKSFIENNRKSSPTNNIAKRVRKTSSEIEIKSIKKKRISSIKKYNNINNSQFERTIQNYHLSLKSICNYIFLFKSRRNNAYILNNFRQKLLSEEYLYILHINMFIFKQKYGCKANLEQLYLLEELYNDF